MVYSFGQNVQKCPKSHPGVLTRKLSMLNFLYIILGEKALEARKELLALTREEHNKLSRL